MAALLTLPRSLVPLPGEALAGFLLRLGHRLDRSPARILDLTGATGGRTKWTGTASRFLVGLPDNGRTALTRTTGLTDQEATGLTLGPLASRYPPVAESLAPRSADGRLRIDNWVYSRFTRYCPQCLAGDGSAIQQQHGGPWKTHWRLPIVFSCREHDVFLQHLCPGCQLPPHAFIAGNISRILPSPSVTGLHPAQCRNPLVRVSTEPGNESVSYICGTRLDRVQPAAVRPSTADLALQDHLHNLLDPRHDAAQAATVFADLRILAAVISTTWPRAAALSQDWDQAAALHTHLEQTRRDFSGQGIKVTSHNTYDKPPASAAATSTLLHISHHLLTLDPADLKDALAMLLERGPRPPNPLWGNTWRRLSATGSPLLRAQLDPAAVFRHTTRILSGLPTSPSRRGGYRPEHIPQHLPENWYMPLLKGPFKHHAKRHELLRRTAAVRLVQLPTGKTTSDAAHYLGLPDTWLRHILATDHRAGPHIARNPLVFDDVVDTIARLLDNLGHAVDYRHRRIQLKDWTLDRAAWDGINDELGPRPTRLRPELDPHRRQSASTIIWTAVTGSERCLAPLIPEAPTDPVSRQAWQSRTSSMHHQIVHSPNDYHAALRDILSRRADALAQETDPAPGRAGS